MQNIGWRETERVMEEERESEIQQNDDCALSCYQFPYDIMQFTDLFAYMHLDL